MKKLFSDGRKLEVKGVQDSRDKITVLYFACNFLLLYKLFWNFTKRSSKYLKMGRSVLVDSFVKVVLSPCGTFKIKETRLCGRDESKITLNNY